MTEQFYMRWHTVVNIILVIDYQKYFYIVPIFLFINTNGQGSVIVLVGVRPKGPSNMIDALTKYDTDERRRQLKVW